MNACFSVKFSKTLVDLICGASFAFSCISVPFRASELLVYRDIVIPWIVKLFHTFNCNIGQAEKC